MSLLSSTVSITRYRVEGKLEEPIIETITDGLHQQAISEIEDDVSEKTIGWTSLENPFHPDFSGSSFVMGTLFVFSLRIDKKTVPSKVLKKHYTLEMARQLAQSGRDYLSRTEKKMLKEQVTEALLSRMPSVPSIYDLIWNYEDASLWFFSNLKAANEELETLFSRSFNLTLIRLFPYTMADFHADLSDTDRDTLTRIMPTNFTE